MMKTDSYFREIISEAENTLTERELFVLYRRNGYPNSEFLTLEEVANELGGLTRERVRQIEQKSLKKLNVKLRRLDMILKFALFYEEKFNGFRSLDLSLYEEFKEPSYMTFDEYLSLIDKDTFDKALALFIGITDNKSRIRVSTDFRFVFNSDGATEDEIAFKLIGTDKNIVSFDEFNKLSPHLRTILHKFYREKDGAYVRRGTLKRSIICEIVDELFPNGIRVTNKDHFEKFKAEYTRRHNVECNITQREISLAMANDGNYCLVNRGTYLRFDKVNLMPQELLEKVITYVLQDGGTLYYSTIFDAFRSELTALGIENWFYLKGVFDKQSKGMFFTRRATLSVNSTKQFENPILDYIKQTPGLITLQELRNRFPGLKDYMFFFRIFGEPEVIALEGGKFIHVDYLKISQEDMKELKNFLDDAISGSDFGIVSSRTLYPALKIYKPDLCKRLGYASEQFGLFSLLSYLFEEIYEFSRPYIALKGTDELSLKGILTRFIIKNKLEKFSFSDLDKYLSKYNTFVNAKISFIEDVADKYLLVNDSDFINLEYLSIENAQQIKDFLIFTINKFKEIKISNFNSYFLIPKNEHIYWNKLSLFSFINAFCSDEIEVKLLNNSYENIDYILRSLKDE